MLVCVHTSKLAACSEVLTVLKMIGYSDLGLGIFLIG